MPYARTPYQQSWPPLIARKRKLADKLERQAAEKRAEADELERRYLAFCARRDAAKAEAAAS